MFPHRSRPSCTCSRSAAVAAVRRAVRRELSAVVHAAMPEASAAVSARAPTRVYGVARGQLPAGLINRGYGRAILVHGLGRMCPDG